MACKASFELYHNFPKLAEEAGFAFNTHRPRVHIEWNKIRLLDIESLIRERKFILIEQHLNDILDCVLESEFDVRILDEGVVKIFRLAQLAVEYQQFCRHYLDRSVYVLREEVTSLAQELNANKQVLREKEDDIRRLKRKSKHIIRTPLPYGNENIATMILNTLKNQSDIFPSVNHLDTLHHNKCNFCDKVFLNQLYLKSHISRRHPNLIESPQKDIPTKDTADVSSNENIKLFVEVEDLKNKLKDMENIISQKHKADGPAEVELKNSSFGEREQEPPKKEMKDAAVFTQDQECLSDKIEDWKKQEFEKYNEELNLLRTQIMQIMDANKEIKNQKPQENETKDIEVLQKTIKEQGAELLILKQELIHSKSLKDKLEAERKKEIETQICEWTKKVEMQSTESRTLLQKLNEMAKDVQEYKALADLERKKAEQLQSLLNQQLKVNSPEKSTEKIKLVNVSNSENNSVDAIIKNSSNKSYQMADRVTLEKLQKKAQELLSMEQSSTSDLSAVSEECNKEEEQKRSMISYNGKKKEIINCNNYFDKQTMKKSESNRSVGVVDKSKSHKTKQNVNKKLKKKIISSKKDSGHTTVPMSPVKVVRAKLTEEVNQRLVQLGVDPLKNRLPKKIFQKQRSLLKDHQEDKVKKYPSREQIYHSIQAHLDANALKTMRKVTNNEDTYVSPSKANKTFSLTSVLSNVKSKAISLVKPNEKNKNYDIKNKNAVPRQVPLENSPLSNKSNITSSKDGTPRQSPYRDQKQFVRKVRQSTKDMNTKKYKTTESTNESDMESDNNAKITVDYAAKSIDDIVKSPVRKPAESNFKRNDIDISETIFESKMNNINVREAIKARQDNSSDDIESLNDTSPRKAFSEENLAQKQTKSVLKNASSTSSLNKKKVLFDMDAIQMRSVSATPSQSIADKSDGSEKYTLGIINLDTEEWDPSSIENEPQPQKSSIQVTTRTSPKIAELKQAIESQMSRRIQTPSTALAGSVNLLPTPMVRTSLGGSNTSLGSSILDESEHFTVGNNKHHKSVVNEKTKKHENDDSEIDFSEFLNDDKSDNKF